VTRTTRVRALIVLAAAVLLVGCGGSTSPSRTRPPSVSPADLPPAWVQNEVAWQALAAGDPHPGSCQWALTTPKRAAFVGGRATSYLRGFGGDPPASMVYVVVLQGHFTPPYDEQPPGLANSLYLVLGADGHGGHYYLAHGFAATSPDLARLGSLHTFTPQLPVTSGVWGHTMFAGGPFPGQWPITGVSVEVWQGSKAFASGPALETVRSDADGFFALDLPPGTYTFLLTGSGHGSPMPATVTVKAGEPVAAGVYGEGM
jgi:hypothetical protein